MDFYLAYCATCKTHLQVDSTPPHAVIHVVATKKHLHALTREELD